LGQLQQLQKLDLSQNQLVTLPPELNQFQPITKI
jgi:Leucine-rich repeat (LRR) protein